MTVIGVRDDFGNLNVVDARGHTRRRPHLLLSSLGSVLGLKRHHRHAAILCDASPVSRDEAGCQRRLRHDVVVQVCPGLVEVLNRDVDDDRMHRRSSKPASSASVSYAPCSAWTAILASVRGSRIAYSSAIVGSMMPTRA
jgi:hypothetical protein